MKILLCGSRYYSKYKKIFSFLKNMKEKYNKLFVVTGDARGADYLTFLSCKDLNIECNIYKAYWSYYGKAAGPIRNKKMLDDNPDIKLVAGFHPYIKNSKGTKDMLMRAQKRNIKVLKFK